MMSKILIGIIRLYQLTLSLILGNRCRFYPSCSSYGIEAIQKHGAFHGSILTIKRLSRCHPFCEGGIDHVPDDLSHNLPKNLHKNRA